MDNTNSNSQLAKTIEKIKHLLALSVKNTNEHEMKAAAAAADKLMTEFRISAAMLEASGERPGEPMVRREVHSGGRRLAWCEALLAGLCHHYGCAWYLSSRRVEVEHQISPELAASMRAAGVKIKDTVGKASYTVVGRVSDTEIVDYMYSYLNEEIDRLGTIFSKGKGISYGVSWRLGCANGVVSQFDDIRKNERQETATSSSHSSAMVLLGNREIEAKKFMRSEIGTRTASGITGGRNSDARGEGYSAGRSMSIRKGLNK